MKKFYLKLSALAAISAFLLTACSPQTGGDAPATVAETDDNQVAETDSETAVATNTAAPTVEEAAPVEEPTATAEIELDDDQILLEDGTVLFTTDDRSDRLASLTRSWNTNWNRRIISTDELLSGGPPRDGIPSIDDPQFVTPEEAEAWLAGNEPVIAVDLNGDARAYPLQILTWHEIVNDTVGGVPVIVTFCPLCNSAIVFERTLEGEAVEFGTSGLLRNSDLVMYDRKTETLWQQFTGEGLIGEKAGEQLTFLPSAIISFDNFREAYPDGMILSQETGFGRSYGRNPYAGYDTIGSNPFLFDGELDERLPAVARVVTVSLPNGIDVAYPLDVLIEEGVINDKQGEQNLVIFHVGGTASALGAPVIADAEDVGATGVFDPVLDGQLLTFRKEGNTIVDNETGSTWNIVGEAIEGELEGERLARIVHADHFWFSWAAFRPDTIIYQP